LVDRLHPGADHDGHHQDEYFFHPFGAQLERRMINKPFSAQRRHLNNRLRKPADEERDGQSVNAESVVEQIEIQEMTPFDTTLMSAGM
jgi:hypothetical protein